MELRTLLIGFIVYALYPAWLAAGAGDYLCHRRTRIEATSGTTESWLHVVQLLSIIAIVFVAAFLEITRSALALMAVVAVCHTVLSYVDVSYTDGRRHISPLEQHVHAFMDVLPLVAVGLLTILYWPEGGSGEAWRWKDDALGLSHRTLLLGSLVLLGGAPAVEELVRTYRASSAERREQRT